MHASVLRALNHNVERTFTDRKEMYWGRQNLKRGQNDSRIYVNTSKKVGDADHLKVFANVDADPEGVAFEYEVLE
jgi:hypothetical protein